MKKDKLDDDTWRFFVINFIIAGTAFGILVHMPAVQYLLLKG